MIIYYDEFVKYIGLLFLKFTLYGIQKAVMTRLLKYNQLYFVFIIIEFAELSQSTLKFRRSAISLSLK